MFQIVILPRADFDMQQSVDWWKNNRSHEQAEKWYLEILEAIESLSGLPKRFSLAPESETLGVALHQMPFGVSSRPTHRLLYTIDGERVIVLRVLHGAQDVITDADELH